MLRLVSEKITFLYIAKAIRSFYKYRMAFTDFHSALEYTSAFFLYFTETLSFEKQLRFWRSVPSFLTIMRYYLMFSVVSPPYCFFLLFRLSFDDFIITVTSYIVKLYFDIFSILFLLSFIYLLFFIFSDILYKFKSIRRTPTFRSSHISQLPKVQSPQIPKCTFWNCKQVLPHKKPDSETSKVRFFSLYSIMTCLLSRFYFLTRSEVPVISFGCSIPISSRSVGTISASFPPSRSA